MGSPYADLANNVRPPRNDTGFVLTTSTTARSYDLRSLKLGRVEQCDVSTPNGDFVYLILHAITADAWVQFGQTSAITLDKSYAQVEGTTGTAIDATAANVAKCGEKIEAGTKAHFLIDRSKDMFMSLQGSAAGTVEGRASSDPIKR